MQGTQEHVHTEDCRSTHQEHVYAKEQVPEPVDILLINLSYNNSGVASC